MSAEGRPLPALIDTPPDDVSDEAVTLANPKTGELLSLTEAEPADLGRYLEDVREWESMARVAKGVVSAELHRRMDREAKWTIHAGSFDVVGQSPGRVEYDVDALRAELKALVAEDAISLDAAKAAIKREVEFKPVVNGIKALLKLGGEIRTRIEATQLPNTKPRSISIKRKT